MVDSSVCEFPNLRMFFEQNPVCFVCFSKALCQASPRASHRGPRDGYETLGIRSESKEGASGSFNNHTVVQMEATNPITIQNNKPCHRLYKFHVTSILTDDGHTILSPSSRVDKASPTSPRHHVLAPDGNGHTTAGIGDVRKSDSSRNPKSEGKFRQ